MSEWAIYYDEQDQRFHKVEPSMIEKIIIEVIDAEKGIYMIEKKIILIDICTSVVDTFNNNYL